MYRFGFILSTSLGNWVGYKNLRKYAERDGEIECTWAPVKHYFAPGDRDPVSFLPRPFYRRAVVINQAWPVLGQMHKFDAVMVFALEAWAYTAVRSLIRSKPPVFAAQDNPPIVDPDNYPLYAADKEKPAWRRNLRRTVDLWMTRHTPYFVPFSHWQAGVLIEKCGISPERVRVIHVGIDLELWPQVDRDRAAITQPVRLLFVGGDFERKGGPQLLEAFAGMYPRMSLDIVTGKSLSTVPQGVTVHTNLPHDDRIRRLYANADIFVLPTTADFSSYASLEAMASGCPVIATDVGGIPDIVRSGRNGLLVKPHDILGLRTGIEALASDPTKRAAMGAEGRRVVEKDFNAAVNVARMLDFMKSVSKDRNGVNAPSMTDPCRG